MHARARVCDGWKIKDHNMNMFLLDLNIRHRQNVKSYSEEGVNEIHK